MTIEPYEQVYKTDFIKLYKQTFLESSVYEEVFSEEEIEDVLNKNETYVLVNDEELVGFICGYAYRQRSTISEIEAMIVNEESIAISFYISELAVKNTYRGQKLGEQLVSYLLTQKVLEGKRCFILHTRLNNPVRSLYQRLKFLPVIDRDGVVMESDVIANTIRGIEKTKGLFLFYQIP